MYRLLTDGNLDGLSDKPVDDSLVVRSKTKIALCVRQSQSFIGYAYNTINSKWETVWNETLFKSEGSYPLNYYPWGTFSFDDGSDVIILRHIEGLKFYKPDLNAKKLRFLTQDAFFHDGRWNPVNGTILWGNFFPSRKYFGVLSRSEKGVVRFHSVKSEHLIGNKRSSHPLRLLKANITLSQAWNNPRSKYFLINLKDEDQQTICVRGDLSLTFYKFDSQFKLVPILNSTAKLETSVSSEVDEIYFINSTDQIFPDIIHFNDTGAYIYKFDAIQNDFNCVLHDESFAITNGWYPEYFNTFKIFRLNSNGSDILSFTGPDGLSLLSFNSTKKRWVQVVKPQSLTTTLRFGRVVGVLPKMSESSLVDLAVQTNDGNVHSVKFEVGSEPKLLETKNSLSLNPNLRGKSPTDPPKIKQVLNATLMDCGNKCKPPKKILRFAEMWDNRIFDNLLEPMRGLMKFKIPLVDYTLSANLKLELNIMYDDSQQNNFNLMGSKWHLPLGQNFITVDFKNSVFSERAAYYFVQSGELFLLKLLKIGEEIMEFELENYSNVKIKYYILAEFWVIEDEHTRGIYGKSNKNNARDAIRQSLAWPQWKGIGRDKSALKPIIISWYLNELTSISENISLYHYYDIDKSVLKDGLEYDISIRLVEITDAREFKLKFEYIPKTSGEFVSYDPENRDGDILFPVKLQDSHYIQKYTLETDKVIQHIEFLYSVVDGKRFLKNVEQYLSWGSETLFCFDYLHVVPNMLEKITTPTGMNITVEYNYEKIKIEPMESKNFELTAAENFKLFFGLNYTLLAERKRDALKITILDSNMLTTKQIFTIDVEVLHYNNTDYTINTMNNAFSVFVDNNNHKVLHLFSFSNGNWVKNDSILYNKNSEIVSNVKAINVCQHPNIWVQHQPKETNWVSSKIPYTGQQPSRIVASEESIVAFDGKKIHHMYKNRNGHIKDQIIYEGDAIKFDLGKIAMSSDTRKDYINFFSKNGLQMFDNVIVATDIIINGSLLSFGLNIFRLGSDYTVHTDGRIEVEQVHMGDVERKVDNKGSSLYLSYVMENGIYKVKVVKAEGEIMKHVRTMKQRNQILQELNEKLKDELLKVWLLPPFQFQLSATGIRDTKGNLYRFTGSKWEYVHSPKHNLNFELGKYFKIEAIEGENAFKLISIDRTTKKAQDVKEFRPYKSELVTFKYPYYIAYQKTQDTLEIIQFETETRLGSEKILNGETIVPTHGGSSLVTRKNNRLNVYPVSLISQASNKSDNQYVAKVVYSSNLVKRTTGYERFSSKCDSGYTLKIITVPAGNKSISGWVEDVWSIPEEPKNVTGNRYWFDVNGQLIKQTEEFQDSKSPQTKQGISKYNVFTEVKDRSGKWVVYDTMPYKINDEMVNYFGFEEHEINSIGNPEDGKKWNIVGGKIMAGDISLTGQSYLRLSSTKPDKPNYIEGTFTPSDQNSVYLTSCWLKTDFPMKMGSLVPFLKVVTKSDSYNKGVISRAVVKQIKNNWYYVESFVNFKTVKDVFLTYLKEKNNLQHHQNSQLHIRASYGQANVFHFNITVRVESQNGYLVDLDHVLFYPQCHKFGANVYDPQSGAITENILANGNIVRSIYDHKNNRIASVDMDENVIEFTTCSRTGKLPVVQPSEMNSFHPNCVTFQPTSGKHIPFNWYIAEQKIKVMNSMAWKMNSNLLKHEGPDLDSVMFENEFFAENNSQTVIRLYVSLNELKAKFSMNWSKFMVEISHYKESKTSISVTGRPLIENLPTTFEIAVALIDNRLIIWCESILLLDHKLELENSDCVWSHFNFSATGSVFLEDLMILNNPKLNVAYFNVWGEKVQELQLEGNDYVILTETLYDGLGRASAVTKPTRMKPSENNDLLSFKDNFVINDDFFDPSSFWHSGILQGTVSNLNPEDQGFPYSRNGYFLDPLNDKKCVGFPGKEFSIVGKYYLSYARTTNSNVLNEIFPDKAGFKKDTKMYPNGSEKVNVYDLKNNHVAEYLKVAGMKPVLCTYEYNEQGNLIKILPPAYHDVVNTITSSRAWEPGYNQLTNDERFYQERLGTFFKFSKNGELLSTMSPDGGEVQYINNINAQRKYMVYLNRISQTAQIVYSNYNPQGELTSTGYFNEPVLLTDLRNVTDNNAKLILGEPFQEFKNVYMFMDLHRHLRNKHFLTTNHKEAVVEQVTLNVHNEIIEKTAFLTVTGEACGKKTYRATYTRGKLQTIYYPVEFLGKPLQLIHSYNNLGKLIRIGLPGVSDYFGSFQYNGMGHISAEYIKPLNFSRTLMYNSPGFITGISDPFLTEKLSYTTKGYGQIGYGDGSVMWTSFNATWPENADTRWFQISKSDPLSKIIPQSCMSSLKRNGYIDAFGTPIKLFYHNNNDLPLMCRGKVGNLISYLLARVQSPQHYGHSYAYGNRKELVKAKYFNGSSPDVKLPLQYNSFSKHIPVLTERESRDIWWILSRNGYIITDQEQPDDKTAIGKIGKPLLREQELKTNLESLDKNFVVYWSSIKMFLEDVVCLKNPQNADSFKTMFLDWNGKNDVNLSSLEINKLEVEAAKIYEMLSKNDFLSPTGALSDSLKSLLESYNKIVPDIVGVLIDHFRSQIGESPYDVESFNIDANGNHRRFYVGQQRSHFTYIPFTNKINSLTLIDFTLGGAQLEQTFSIKHDAFGNIIEALHRGIKKIDYHPASQRPTRIVLQDERWLQIYYDSSGERIFKRTFRSNGRIEKEVRYLRDDKGRVLVDEMTMYQKSTKMSKKVITAYLYGPRGLFGFIRNGEFYNVSTDHAGSVRLVIKDGQVVAAYDYLPYGQLMRSFGQGANGEIYYRYTGQEWDEETGLYNFHARLYDPSIGRFYQPDPKSQDFSPYKYAGNSPISNIDPDGEFFFIIAFALIGAYLGGAAANNNWNIFEWNFKDIETWEGIIGGGITGAFIPSSLVSTVHVLSLYMTTNTAIATTGVLAGVGFLSNFITKAAKSNWDLSDPNIWYEGFQGIDYFTDVTSIKSVHLFAAKSIAKQYRKAFLTMSYAFAAGLSYVYVSMENEDFRFWKWNFEDPTTWNTGIGGFIKGLGIPKSFIERAGGLQRFIRGHKAEIPDMIKNPVIVNALLSVLDDIDHPLHKAIAVGIMAYIADSETDDTSLKKTLTSLLTKYEWILNTLFKVDESSELLEKSTNLTIVLKSSIPVANTLIDSDKSSSTFDMVSVKSKLIELKKRELDNMVHQVFNNSTLALIVLNSLSFSVRNESEYFLKSGSHKWERGETQPSPHLLEALKTQSNLYSSELIKLLDEFSEIELQDEYKAKDHHQLVNLEGCGKGNPELLIPNDSNLCSDWDYITDLGSPVINSSSGYDPNLVGKVDSSKTNYLNISSIPAKRSKILDDQSMIRSRKVRGVDRETEVQSLSTGQCENCDGDSVLFEEFVTSSASSQKFWLDGLMKHVGRKINAWVFSNDKAHDRINGNDKWQHQWSSNKNYYHPKTRDSKFLALGDQWLSNTNVIGNLYWISMLTGRWCGFTIPKETRRMATENSEKEMFSVDRNNVALSFSNVFLDLLMEEADHPLICTKIDNPAIYFDLVAIVNKRIYENGYYLLPEHVVIQFFNKHFKSIASIMGDMEANQFYNKIRSRVSFLKTRLNKNLEDH